MTDRLRCIQPPPAVDVYYSPSIDRIILSGVDGYGSGHYISLADDSESYYGDTGQSRLQTGTGSFASAQENFRAQCTSLRSEVDSLLALLPPTPQLGQSTSAGKVSDPADQGQSV